MSGAKADYEKYMLSTGTHWISNSGSDENGKYTGGAAGDQNGKEWRLKAWYDRPWTVILRWPDQAVAERLAELAVDAALNDKVGYDQFQRTTYWQELQKAGYDPSKIAAACEADCTAGVSANVRAAGHIFGIKALQDVPICTSRNMRAEFAKAGFQALTASKYLTGGGWLLPGDVLLYENHHAATNVTVGEKVKVEWTPGAGAEGSAPTDDANTRYIEITGGSVYVLKGQWTGYGSMGVAHKGDRLRWFGYVYANGWPLVEYRGQTGWVSGKYGKIEEG